MKCSSQERQQRLQGVDIDEGGESRGGCREKALVLLNLLLEGPHLGPF